MSHNLTTVFIPREFLPVFLSPLFGDSLTCSAFNTLGGGLGQSLEGGSTVVTSQSVARLHSKEVV